MSISLETKVGEVVKQNFKTALLFQASNIDYCCGGQQTISEACTAVGIEPLQFISQLETMADSYDSDSEYINSLSLGELSEYIVRRHHSYVRKSITFLKASLEKIADVHGGRHPELFEIKKLFELSSGELIMHMQKEEILLFPYIEAMSKAKEEGRSIGRPVFGDVSNPIRAMITEHESEGSRFATIAELSGNYSLPEDGCTTYKITYDTLKEFESDLHRHIHLENNILFPGAIELESELKG